MPSILFFIQQNMVTIMSIPFVFQALTSLLIFFLISKWFRNPQKTKNFPPSPPKLPLLGNFHQLSSLPHRDLQQLAQKYGPMMLVWFGKVPTLVVSSAEGAREIMKTHDIDFADRPKSWVIERLLYNYKDVSVAPYGEYWRQLKSICVLQLLSNKRVHSFHSIREEEISLLVKKIRSSSSLSPYGLNLSDMFTQATNDIVCRATFGRKFSEGKQGKKFLSLLTELLQLLGTPYIGDYIPCLSWITRLNGFDARVDKFAREMDEFLEHLIEERLKGNPNKKKEDKKKYGENFIDILLDIYQNNLAGVSIDRDGVKATLLDAFGAGTDTTSTVVEWAMSELLKHPQVMKRLQVEIREIMRDRCDITDSDMEKMSYLKAVIKETLRLHTPIPTLVAHIARKDVKIMGYDISSGTMVLTNAWAIGRDPKTWDEPEKFNPDRFLNSLTDVRGHNFELIPFGAGRRACPGISFAMVTNECVLANLLHKFDWKLVDEGKELDMSERPGVSIRRAVPLLAVASEYHF